MSVEVLGLVVAFIGGVLVDHFFFNKLAGLVSADVAKVQADVAAVVAKFNPTAVPVAPATPAAPPAATAPAAKSV